MNRDTRESAADGFKISIDHKHANVRIPHLEGDAQVDFVDDEFLPRVDCRGVDTWVIDLSEYEDGLTLPLAGVLIRLGEEARSRGCAVRFSGVCPVPALQHGA